MISYTVIRYFGAHDAISPGNRLVAFFVSGTGAIVTAKQEIWLEEYLTAWNATEAARRAGYSQPRIEGARNKAKLAKEISERVAAIAMSADEALVLLSQQARAEYAAYFSVDENGAPKFDFQKLIADGKGHLVKSIKNTQWGVQIEFYDAQTALLNVGRHHGMFTDKVDLSGQMELKEHESAAERILSRIDSIAARIRTQAPAVGDSTDGDGTEGTGV